MRNFIRVYILELFLSSINQFSNEQIVDTLGLPVFVKPSDSGSSYGISKVKDISELTPALETAFKEGKTVVIESFLDGTEVGVNYDPMLAKLVVWGENRDIAISKSIHSLDEVLFLGVKTNRDYLKRILAHKDFIAGKTHTHFIPDHKNDLEPKKLSDQDMAHLIAAMSFSNSKIASHAGSENLKNPWTELTGFRN
jgi:acetyl/propionyl-CoA carboxylase alpha subunit